MIEESSSPPLPAGCLVYIWPEMFCDAPGLGHMKEIARTLFVEARLCRRTPVLPPLISNPQHNVGRSDLLNWSDYYDWSEFPHRVLPCQSPGDLQRLLAGTAWQLLHETRSTYPTPPSDAPVLIRAFPDPDIFGEWLSHADSRPFPEIQEPKFSTRFPENVRRLAHQVGVESGPFEGVLHVRRGDLLDPAVEPEGVINRLHAQAVPPPARVLVLTNESSPAFAEKLRGSYPNLLCEFEIPLLSMLRQPGGDNYLAYRIGACLQELWPPNLGSLRVLGKGTTPPAPWFARLNQRWKRQRLWLDFDRLPPSSPSATPPLANGTA